MIINDNPKLQVDVPNYSGFTMDHYGSLWIHYIQFGTSTMDHYGFSSCLVTIGCAAWQIMRYQGRMMKGPALGVLGHTLRLVTSMTRIVPRKVKRCRKTTQNISSVSTIFFKHMKKMTCHPLISRCSPMVHRLIHRVTLQIGGVGHVDLEALGLAVLRNSNMFR